jgi:hypothetical protein
MSERQYALRKQPNTPLDRSGGCAFCVVRAKAKEEKEIVSRDKTHFISEYQ